MVQQVSQYIASGCVLFYYIATFFYDMMSAATADYLMNGRPTEYDERTWLDMLLVKHALIAAEKMKSEGDTVSGMTDDMSSSSYD